MWNIIYIFVVLISIVYLPEQLNGIDIQFKDPFWIPKELVFMIGSTIAIGFSIVNGVDSERFRNKWIGIAFVVLVISSLLRFMIPLIFNDLNGKIIFNLFLIRPTINFILGSILVYVLVEKSNLSDLVTLA